jgi:hypothetical protein
MFNQQILQRLMKANRSDPFNSYGEHQKMTGGIRYKEHPTPEMDFQPDDLYTGSEQYEGIKPRMIGGRVPSGLGKIVHGDMVNGLSRGGSLKSIGKSLKKIGKSVGKVVVPLATDVGKNIVKNIATKKGQAYIEKQLAKYAAEALPVVEEAAPLLLAAAGRKVGRTSGGKVSGGIVGDRRSARASLVKKIMREHGVSLPEASKYIKENGIEY